MKAVILNSGMGKRMGELTDDYPKCMTEIYKDESIISKQLKQLTSFNISEVIITTGYFNSVLIDYVYSLNLNLNYKFINNPLYDKTNYIYSIYLAKEHVKDDIILMHGDLVFDDKILFEVLNYSKSCMTISSTLALPSKDFKAVITNKTIEKVGIEFFENAFAAQPLYKILYKDWKVWLDKIIEYCENDKVSCYAENAFNEVSDKCKIYPYDFSDELCAEIDTPADLEIIQKRLNIS